MHKEPEHPPDQDPSTEDQGRDNEKPKGANRKPKVRAWIWWTFITGFLGVAAQFVESWDHSLLIPSLVLFFSGFLTGACALWIHLTNNGETHKRASTRAFSVVFIGFVICAGLFWWKQPLPQNADLLEPSSEPRRVFESMTPEAV
jgi:hypothetical protein